MRACNGGVIREGDGEGGKKEGRGGRREGRGENERMRMQFMRFGLHFCIPVPRGACMFPRALPFMESSRRLGMQNDGIVRVAGTGSSFSLLFYMTGLARDGRNAVTQYPNHTDRPLLSSQRRTRPLGLGLSDFSRSFSLSRSVLPADACVGTLSGLDPICISSLLPLLIILFLSTLPLTLLFPSSFFVTVFTPYFFIFSSFLSLLHLLTFLYLYLSFIFFLPSPPTPSSSSPPPPLDGTSSCQVARLTCI